VLDELGASNMEANRWWWFALRRRVRCTTSTHRFEPASFGQVLLGRLAASGGLPSVLPPDPARTARPIWARSSFPPERSLTRRAWSRSPDPR